MDGIVSKFNNIAVIGSGVMGSSIAAHFANCNVNVLLFDLPSLDKSANRSAISTAALKRLIEDNNQLIDQEKANFIKPVNLEDDLSKLQEVDLIIEAVTEDLAIKSTIYHKIKPFVTESTIIGSNTSTIQLKALQDAAPEQIKNQIVITHFFNPPRYLPLVEMIAGENFDKNSLSNFKIFLENNLGRVVVNAKDSPGFMANRVGCIWMLLNLEEVLIQIEKSDEDIQLEKLDAYMHKYFKIAKTGVFGLFDLIGIDVMEKIIHSLQTNLKKHDLINQLELSCKFVARMVEKKMFGRKNGKGFYHTEIIDGKKTKRVLNLKDFTYRGVTEIPVYEDIKDFSSKDEFSFHILNKVNCVMINYTVEHLYEMTNSLYEIDEAMCYGYNWGMGPFAIADNMGDKFYTGIQNLIKYLHKYGVQPAAMLEEIKTQGFYRMNYQYKQYYHNKLYYDIPVKDSMLTVSNIKKRKNAVYGTEKVSLWDMGEDILLLTFSNSLGLLDEKIFDFIIHAEKNIFPNFKAVIIANDGECFSAGANIKKFLEFTEKNDYEGLKKFLELGQQTMLAIKYSSIPVICAVENIALGGGCEILLHSHGSQFSLNSTIGLVETSLGVIPAWGGCKEMLLKAFEDPTIVDNKQYCLQAFGNILHARKVYSGFEANKVGYSAKYCRINNNKNLVLSNAYDLAIELSSSFIPRSISKTIYFDCEAFRQTFIDDLQLDSLEGMKKDIAGAMLDIFTGYDDKPCNEKTIMEKEIKHFIRLIKNKETQKYIASVVKR